MLRVSMSELKTEKENGRLPGITVSILRIPEEVGRHDKAIYIAGIRTLDGVPVGIVRYSDRQGSGIKYWKRADFITTSLMKTFPMEFPQSNTINCHAVLDDMLRKFVSDFQVDVHDRHPLATQVNQQRLELLDLMGRRDLDRAGNKGTANA